MQPSRNFDDLKFSSIHRRILLWGSGGPFLDGYVLVMIGVALEQLTPALKLDADWIGLLGAGTLAGLFDAPRDKCTLSCAINGIHAAFHYLKKNYISGCVMTVPTG